MVFGIGQFHVHGHQESCFGRFSPVFIEGIGWVSGEIVESNWSLINPVGLTCTTMTAAHRYEVLDAKMLDLNWKKMTLLGKWGLKTSMPRV
jgi:Kyakuja-Dileera-Zisupton transposase